MPNLVHVVAGHRRTFAGLAAGLLAYCLISGPFGLPLHGAPRMIAAWDVGGIVFLLACALLFSTTPPINMPANADAQQEGEWTIFAITILGVAASFAAIVSGFSGTKDLTVHVLVDASRSMDWGDTESGLAPEGGAPAAATHDTNKLLYAKRTAAALSYIALANFDRVTVGAFNLLR